jgi:hypothetical protein
MSNLEPAAICLDRRTGTRIFFLTVFYEEVGHVIGAALGSGVYFWAVMNNAMIASFRESAGIFGGRPRIDIFTAITAVSVADLHAIINTSGATFAVGISKNWLTVMIGQARIFGEI